MRRARRKGPGMMWERRYVGAAVSALLWWGMSACAGQVWFVDGGAGHAGDGRTWDAPFNRLGDAITSSRPGDEIWVRAGTYTPSEHDATMSFALKSGVAIYGGFAGGEAAREQRDWRINITRLSGDIGGDDLTEPHEIVGANSGHVVACGAVEPTAVLDGFIIERGGSGPLDTPETSSLVHGSGLFCLGGSPTIRNCTFRDNHAVHKWGGAIYLLDGAPTIDNCRFESNVAHRGGGGAICLDGLTPPMLIDCTFIDNRCATQVDGDGGGALLHRGGVLRMTRCTFEANSAMSITSDPNIAARGGGLLVTNGALLLRDCIFDANSATLGGGLATDVPSQLTNCLIVNNRAAAPDSVTDERESSGGGVWSASGDTVLASSTIAMNAADRAAGIDAQAGAFTLTNSIVWGNQSHDPMYADTWREQISDHFALRHSCIEWLFQPGPHDDEMDVEGQTIIGCISTDPLFRDPEVTDYRLARISPCIDVGDDMLVTIAEVPTDLAGAPRITALRGGEARIDMGCYERMPIAGCYEIGDADGDETVGVGDLSLLLYDFGRSGFDLAGDLNDDQLVDLADLTIMLAHWGSRCSVDQSDDARNSRDQSLQREDARADAFDTRLLP